MTILVNASDTFVSETRPTVNFATVHKLRVAGDTGSRRFAYIFFARPVKPDRTVTVGKLRLWSGVAFNGAVSISLRRLGEKFRVNRVTFETRPATVGTKVATVTKSNAPAKTLWEFDIKDLLEDLAGGAEWYGLRIEASGGSNEKWFYSSDGPEDYRPQLEVVTSEAPDQPTDLYPRNDMAVSVPKPTLRWLFTDPSDSDDTLQAFRVALYGTKADADGNTNSILDTGQIPGTESIYDLDDATSFTGLTEGQNVWWKVMHWDSTGLSSEWSDPVQFHRTSKPVATWVSPAAGSNLVNDPTPPFAWTFADQKAMRFRLFDPAEPAVALYDSGKIATTVRSFTPPKGYIKESGKLYRAEVRLFDSVVRANLPDDDPYVTLTTDFTFERSGTVEPPVGLTLAKSSVVDAWVDLTWFRSATPDEWIIYRNGVEIDRQDGPDLSAGGTSYKTVDRLAKPRRNNKYEVTAMQNGKASLPVTATIKITTAKTTALASADGTRVLSIWNPAREAGLTEDSELHRLLGNAAPVLIVQSLGDGYAGKVSGVLVGDFGVAIEDQVDNLDWFRKNTGVTHRLTYVDRAMKVVVYNLTYEPVSNPDGTVDYELSFEFFEDEA